MCGIVGYVGKRSAQDVLLDGLEKLEYRGYDSAGVALALDGGIRVVKSKGRLTALREKLAAQQLAQSFCGIGHTRWATHGEPSDVNSHPHSTPRVSIVHNGIIENYGLLKERLAAKGYTFQSETDTEVLVKLIDSCYTGDPLRRLLDVLREDYGLTGSKEGCGEGECGACSIIKNGKLVTPCIIPVGAIQGAELLTIEGIRDTEKGKCIIEAYAEGGAVQCGFCIPGMVMATYVLLNENPDPTEDEIRLGISGNLCRCTGYDLIVESIHLAAEKGAALWKK